MTPKQLIEAQRLEVERISQLELTASECGDCGSLLYDDGDDDGICLSCAASALTRMQDAFRSGRPLAPIEDCPVCGEAMDVAGQMPVCHSCAAQARADATDALSDSGAVDE